MSDSDEEFILGGQAVWVGIRKPEEQKAFFEALKKLIKEYKVTADFFKKF